MNMAIFAVLTWYFDHVASGNRGRAFKPLFFCKRNYWTRRKRAVIEQISVNEKEEKLLINSPTKEKINDNNIVSINDNYSETDTEDLYIENSGEKTVDLEKTKVQSLINSENINYYNGLLIYGLNKTYKIVQKFCRIRRVNALKKVKDKYFIFRHIYIYHKEKYLLY
jgi:hypothetical protein